MRPKTFGHLLHEHAAAAKLPRIWLHDARRSAASLLAGIGTPIVVAAGLLGYHPNVCAHLYLEVKEKAINVLEPVLLAEAKLTNQSRCDGCGQTHDQWLIYPHPAGGWWRTDVYMSPEPDEEQA